MGGEKRVKPKVKITIEDTDAGNKTVEDDPAACKVCQDYFFAEFQNSHRLNGFCMLLH